MGNFHSYLQWKKHAILMAGKGSAGQWWLPPGLDPSDCIAAYQFKDVETETIARTNLVNPNTYSPISKNNSPEWDTEKGYFLQNTSFLNATNIDLEDEIGTMIVRYSGFSTSDNLVQMTNIRRQNVANSFYHFVYAARFQIEYIEGGTQRTLTSENPGIVYYWRGAQGVSNPDYKLKYCLAEAPVATSGVLGASVWVNDNDNLQGGLWMDGVRLTTHGNTIENVTGIVNRGMGNTNDQTLSPSATGHWVIAAAYYKPRLSQDHHAWVADAMNCI